MLFTDDSVGRVLGGAARTTSDTNSRISFLIRDFPVSSTFLPQLNLKSMFWGLWIQLFRVLFVVASGGFFRQSTWRCSNSACISLLRVLFVVASGVFFRQSAWRCSNSPRKKIARVPPA